MIKRTINILLTFGIIVSVYSCTSTKEIASSTNAPETKENSNDSLQQRKTDQEGLKKAEERTARLTLENSEKIKQRQKRLKDAKKENPSHK